MKVKKIFLHCSASEWGDVLSIDRSHKARGWAGIGYHFVILNGKPNSESYFEFLDGQIHSGRHLDGDHNFESDEIGAQVRGYNLSSVGVCLVGRKSFSDAQLSSVKILCLTLYKQFDLCTADVLGHYEAEGTSKTCPNIPMNHFRTYLDGMTTLDYLRGKIAAHVKEIYGER